jgi:nitronate monooxygenase
VLGHAYDGDVRKGLFFRGAGRVPFGRQIRPVQDLLNWLVPTQVPAPAQMAAVAVAPSKIAEVPVA